MLELLRNCSHGSEIATYLATDKFLNKEILKASSTPKGIIELEKEIEGWNFYQKKRYPGTTDTLCKVLHRRKNYLKIGITYIDGFEPDYKKRLEENAQILREIVKQYCRIWPYSSGKYSPIHGDLSISGNIIINQEGIHIIDWEHFTLDGGPWGFDIIYLLFEALFLSIRDGKDPDSSQITIISENLNRLNSLGWLPGSIIQRPLRFLKDFIFGNPRIWGEQTPKFPILKIKEQQVTRIDNLVWQGITCLQKLM